MSYSSLFSKASISAVALALGGCASLGDRGANLPRQAVTVSDEVKNNVVVLDPCSRENIKARPAREVTPQEMNQRTRDGEINYFVNGYYLFSQKSMIEKWAPVAGALAGGALGNGIGSGVVRGAMTILGAGGGGFGGEVLSENAKFQRMIKESGCEAFLRAGGPAPQPHTLDMNGPDVPVNRGTARRQYLNEHVFTR